MKTGANSLMNNMDSNIMPVLPNACDRHSTTEENVNVAVARTDDDCATPDVMSVEMLRSSSTVSSSTSSLSSEEDISSSETEARSLEDDDDDLLDLLAETLDVDFDPDLLLL